MSDKQKLCIVKDNRDLLKIIPINDKNGVGFKIVLPALIETRFFPINYNNICHVGKISTTDTALNFTYHTAGNGLKTNLHFKTDSTPGRKYWDVPFCNLTELSEKQIIPMPLCKIICNDSSAFPEHHNKTKNKIQLLGENIEHNMDFHNVAEIFIVPANYKSSFKKLFDSWDLFFLTMNILPMEYFSIPTPENLSFKARSMGNGRNIISSTIDQFNDKISFMICTYYLSENPINSSNYFSLFENGKYIEHLAITRLCFKDQYGQKTPIKPLYQWQLERNEGKISHSDSVNWQKFFSQAENDLASKLKGVIIQNI